MSVQTHEIYMTDRDFGEGAALHRLLSKQARRNFKQSSKWLQGTFLVVSDACHAWGSYHYEELYRKEQIK